MVKLIWITPETEKLIVYQARVSNPKNQDSTKTQLLNYCLKNGHWSIFEMANMCIEINCSRAIARQILRHRKFSFQEFSFRYQKVTELSKQPVLNEARRQDFKNRQNSIDDFEKETKDWFIQRQHNAWEEALEDYQEALDKGIAKECARVFLPEGLAPSRMYVNGDIRTWIHYLQLRSGNGTQKEHQEIAEQIQQIFIKELPIISQALAWKGE